MAKLPLFVSYSHADQDWMTQFTDHLASLENDGLVEVWDDRELRAGSRQTWEEQLMPRLNQARVIVLLLSPAFANSEYCQKVELPLALDKKDKGEALVFLVHLRAYDVEERLKKYQILPSEKQSVKASPDSDVAFQGIVARIRKEMSDFQPASSGSPTVLKVSKRQLPEYLPFLCDRAEQEDALLQVRDEDTTGFLRPLVFLLSGPDVENHHGFHHRLAKDLFPLFGLGASIEPRPLDWPTRATPGPEAEKVFAMRVARTLDSLSRNPVDLLKDLPEGLNFLTTTISGEDWDSKQQKLVRSFLDYWTSWPDILGKRAICMGISIVWKDDGPTEKALKKAFPDETWPAVRFAVLPVLEPPKQKHAQDWLSHRKVKAFYDAETWLLQLQGKVPEKFQGRRAMPMQELTKPLIELLESAQ